MIRPHGVLASAVIVAVLSAILSPAIAHAENFGPPRGYEMFQRRGQGMRREIAPPPPVQNPTPEPSAPEVPKEPIAKRIRDWERSQQDRYLADYRRLLAAVQAALDGTENWFAQENQSIRSLPDGLVPSEKASNYVENERRRRMTHIHRQMQRLGECLRAGLSTVADTGDRLRQQKSSPPEATALSCPDFAAAAETEHARKNAQLGFANLVKLNKEIEAEETRRAQEPKTPAPAAAPPSSTPPAQRPGQNAPVQGVQPAQQAAPATGPEQFSLFKTFQGKRLLVSWIYDGKKMNDSQWNGEMTVAVLKLLDGKTIALGIGDNGEILHAGKVLTPDIWVEEQPNSGSYVKNDAADQWHKKSISEKLSGRSLKAKREKLAAQLAEMTKAVVDTSEPTPFVFGKAEPGPVFDNRAPVIVTDRFGRDVSAHGISILDWEGNIANPAILLKMRKNTQTRSGYLNVAMRVADTLFYFDEPVQIDESGARKYLSLGRGSEEKEFYVSMYPDRNSTSEERELVLHVWESNSSAEVSRPSEIPPQAQRIVIPLHVLDDDSPTIDPTPPVLTPVTSWPFVGSASQPRLRPGYPFAQWSNDLPKVAPLTINLDFSLDPTGFFAERSEAAAERRRVFQAAAADWAHNIGDSGFQRVRRHEEQTTIIMSGDVKWTTTGENAAQKVKNLFSYDGMYIYVIGSDERKGGFESDSLGGATGSGFHANTGLRRSGQIITQGTWKVGNFVTDLTESNWWKIHFERESKVDLYSLALHEIGHVLFADRYYKLFHDWVADGIADSFAADDYQAARVTVDLDYHLTGDADHPKQKPVIDRESLRAAFGATVGKVPHHRWLITKVDLLLLKEMGYKLVRNLTRENPTWEKDALAAGTKGVHYLHQFRVTGGIPNYYWGIVEGRLPKGLALDSYLGEIKGTPQESGEFHLVMNFRDNSNQTYGFQTRYYNLVVTQ